MRQLEQIGAEKAIGSYVKENRPFTACLKLRRREIPTVTELRMWGISLTRVCDLDHFSVILGCAPAPKAQW